MKKSRVSDKENQWPEDKLNNLLSSNDHISMSVNKNFEDTMNEILVEKLRQCLPKHQENYETIKSLLAKLYTRITSSDRKVRERTLETMWSKDYNVIEIFIVLLEACKDNGVCCNITGILHECIAPRQSKVKLKGAKNKHSKSASRTTIAQLIQFGGTQVFLKLLINSQRTDNTMTEILIYEILWILSQIAQKDQKFPIKVRLLNVTKVFNLLLKNNYNDARLLLPLLLILKSLAKNTCAVQILVKDGIASSLEKTFVCIGYSPHLKLKVLLECLKHFTANRLCCAKFVKGNLVHMLMRVFERWDRWDGQLRQKIANYGLCTLHHLCSIKSGRRALKANNGLQLLYRFCSNCPETKPYDFLLSRVCGIISQCLEKRDLPVPEMSPAKFNLPNGNGKRANSVDSCSDVESQANSVNSAGRVCSDADSVDDDDDDDNDDDYSGDQCALNIDKNKLKHFNDVNADEGQYFASVITSQRTTEDLLGYSVLFRELGNLETQLMMESQSNSEDSIVESVMSKETKRTQLLSDVKSCDSNNWTGVCTQITDVEALPYLRKLRLLDGIPQNAQEKTIYCICASRVRSVISFVKVAYPDLIGGCCRGNPEPLNDKDRKVCRAKLLSSVDRGLRPNLHTQEVIFDLDALSMTCQTAGGTSSSSSSERLDRLVLGNSDESHTGSRCIETKSLLFESRFESGNLRKVIQIGPQEYDLILTPDVNSGSRHQWFYFQVSNMEANIPYTFNIVNCEKANSQFNFGMKPILFSVTEAQLGRPGWVRTGSDICYYRNCYRRPCRGKNYLTTSFNVTFPHSYDICYLAYHFPYTYSQLMTHIWRWSRLEKESVHFSAEILCNTLNNNECPLLTITSPESTQNPISKRKIIFLTSRVHPGESNSSWVIHGTLEALLADSTYAKSLRDDYIFKIVPMLNIEGVVNGCNRYGLTNEDLNRRWSNPSRVLHPVIYHTKGLMEYCSRVLHRPPHVFVDYHGHSRRKNVFLFGCSRSGSWSAADREKPDQPDHYLMLPRLMQKTSPAFALPLCSFKVERSKESTARVAIWRQLGVARSYTMESSFCGCDQGPLAGLHLDTNHLRNVGRDFCQALAFLKDTTDNWILDKSSTSEECCPLECVKKKCKRPKCIQDKHANQHIDAIRRNSIIVGN